MIKSSVTRIEIYTENAELDGRLKLLKRLFTFTLLMFRYEGTNHRISKIRLFLAIILTAACEF
jgi:hypothetical protein